MFLGTSRWIWLLITVLVVIGLGLIATGSRFFGIVVLFVGLLLFAASPSGPKRTNTPREVASDSLPPATTMTPTLLPPPPAIPAPHREPLDIEAGDPSQV